MPQKWVPSQQSGNEIEVEINFRIKGNFDQAFPDDLH